MEVVGMVLNCMAEDAVVAMDGAWLERESLKGSEGSQKLFET